MTIIYRKIIVIVCFLVSLIPAAGHTDTRKFQIDVLIFSQTATATESLDMSDPAIKWPKNTIRPGQRSTQKLSTSSSTLSGAASTLGRKSKYTVLEHISWVQTIASERAGRPVRIQGTEVDGFVQLKRGANLHLTIGFEYSPKNTDNTYTISEQRRILFNQRHYFDHPLFGVIVTVSPL